MRGAKERVEDEYAHPTEGAQGNFRELLGIGDIAEVSNPVPVHGDGSVRHDHRQYVDISNPETLACRHFMRANLRLAGARKWLDGFVEDVSEAPGQSLHCVWRAVHLDRYVALVREGADIVDAVDVIRVIVSEQNGVDSAHIRRDELETQLGRSIDEDARSAIGLYERTNTRSLVPGISRPAHLTRASDLRDAKAGSCSQESEFQTVSTLRRLVVPGMSNGTPAVTMIRSPFDASSLSATTLLVRPIISS